MMESEVIKLTSASIDRLLRVNCRIAGQSAGKLPDI
jgi:hypothetical protein